MNTEIIKKSLYSEHLKDFLGAVFPGSFLLFCLIFIFFGPVIILDVIIKQTTYNISQWTEIVKTLTQNITVLGSITTLVLFFMFSFVFGSIYYRRTCDLPNQESILKLLTKDYVFLSYVNRKKRYFSRTIMRKRVAKYLTDNTEKLEIIDSYIRNKYGIDGIKGIGVIKVRRINILKNIIRIIRNPIKFIRSKKYHYIHFNYCNRKCSLNIPVFNIFIQENEYFLYTEEFIIGKKKINIKYPFCCISKYLEKNGYLELSKKIPCPSDNLKRNYVNELKVKYRDDIVKVFELEKIEAHIRYSASMWYVAKSITTLTYIMSVFFIFSIVLICIKIGNIDYLINPLYNNLYLVSFIAIMNIGCFFVCLRIFNYIENYLHKQRIAENIIALELI